ncbi:hypothetical protein [Anatilimnocola floriformis]|uniref:hypothetical protein n=1 Tax=Anatilimnocola floriformis TaxID=2948575 RepID=UPI0020C36428|nr:hypothetical protein [Anatilimnocola floriformis]
MSTIPSPKIATNQPPRAAKSKDELRAMYAEQDRARDALKKKLGVVNVVVELIREGRDGE